MKKVMFITHQLTRTGAPIVMMKAVRILHDAGCEIHMISMNEGELREDVEALGIKLTIRNEFMEDWKSFLTPIWDFDLVFVNTIVPLQTIHLLNLAHMPVIWWIHEPEVYFDVYGKWLPDFRELKPHIHVWAVSPVVKDLIQERCHYDAELVPFGIEDTKTRKEEAPKKEIRLPITFLTIGVYCKRKGQDLLQKAIELLPDEISRKCLFQFCGNQTDTEPDVYEPLKKFVNTQGNAELLPEMKHEDMLRTIEMADFLLIPSRQDPMPTVAAEAMELSVPCVISDVCGIARYLRDRESGIIFSGNNVKALRDAIGGAVSLYEEHPEDYRAMCKNARARYEEEFSEEKFRDTLLDALGE